ncbi:Fic family protein [Candidatus Woesearchaeota archaeon]|nr:Fic family protein [Candidatus Woesearchaeota archaeon]
MNENNFVNNVTGKLVWKNQGMYYLFEPSNLPFKFDESVELSGQAQNTMLALGKLDGLTQKFTSQEIALFQLPFMLKEAQMSSEIEGTRSTISDVFKEEKIKELDPERKLDNEEIRNYRDAMKYAFKEKVMTIQFIKEIHKILLKGVRGENKTPGKFKIDQNAIGKREDTLDTATFVPASPQTTPNLIDNLIEYSNENLLQKLYQIGIIHYQFEAIHPFRDGNGRIGRLLIVHLLCIKNILSHPLLYISEYLTKNKDTYIEKLFNVSSKGEIKEWLLFFLKAMEVQALKAFNLLNEIDNYKDELHKKSVTMSQSPNMYILIDSLFKQPFFTVHDVKEILNISQPGAWGLVQKLIEKNIVIESKGRSNKKVYVAFKIINLLEGREVFTK